MKQARYPPGWDAARIARVLQHYESQSDSEAIAEDEAVFDNLGQTTIEVPNDLVPAIRDLIAKHKESSQ